MRVLVTGGGGLLARAVVPALREAGYRVEATTRAELDVTDADQVHRTFERLAPAAVVHCAAFTSVDAAEANEDEAFRINAGGAATVAAACQRFGSLLVYPSTDYVFDGAANRPYRPDSPVAPLSAYGRSKAAGEEAARAAPQAIIVRTSWLYGAGGPNFVDTIRRLAREKERLEVVEDQVGNPSWSSSIARTIARLLKVGALGTFHAADSGIPVSWYGFAKKILEIEGLEVDLVPVSSETFGRPAPRPKYSVLDCSGTEAKLGYRLPPWETSLARYLIGTSDNRSL